MLRTDGTSNGVVECASSTEWLVTHQSELNDPHVYVASDIQSQSQGTRPLLPLPGGLALRAPASVK